MYHNEISSTHVRLEVPQYALLLPYVLIPFLRLLEESWNKTNEAESVQHAPSLCL